MSPTRLIVFAGALLALTGCDDPCNGACGPGESCLSNGDSRIPIISPTFGGSSNETYSCKPTPPFFLNSVAGVGVVVVADGGCSLVADAGACAVCIETACCAAAAACPADAGADAGCAPLDQCASENCAAECPGVP